MAFTTPLANTLIFNHRGGMLRQADIMVSLIYPVADAFVVKDTLMLADAVMIMADSARRRQRNVMISSTLKRYVRTLALIVPFSGVRPAHSDVEPDHTTGEYMTGEGSSRFPC